LTFRPLSATFIGRKLIECQPNVLFVETTMMSRLCAELLHPLPAEAIAIGGSRPGNKSTVGRSREIDALGCRRRRQPRHRRRWHRVPRGLRAHIACTGDGHFWYTDWLARDGRGLES